MLRKMIIRGAIAAGTLAVLAGAGATPAVAAPSAARTAVYGFGGACPNGKWGKPEVRPAKAWFTASCEDGLRRLHWTAWGRKTAKGSGQHLLIGAKGITRHAATVVLSGVRVHNGRKYFSHLVIKWTTKSHKHRQEAFSWQHTNLGWLWFPFKPKPGR